MTAVTHGAAPRAGIRRDAATWYAYLALGYFTYLNTSQGNIVPFLKAELDLNYRAVSLHSSAIALGLLCIGLVGDRLIVRFGRRAMLVFGTLASALAMFFLALAPSVQVTVGACFFMGLTGAFIPAIVSALLSDLHGARRDIAITEANAICYAFAIAAPLITGLAVWAGWSWRLVPLAGVAAAIVIVGVYARYPIPAGAETSAAERNAALPAAYWGYWAMLGLGVALEFSVLLWAPAYLEQVIGFSASGAALGAGVFFVAMLIGRLVGVRLVGMYPARDIYFVVAATAFVGFLAYWLVPLPAVVIGGLFLIGLGVSLVFPIAISFALGAAGTAASDRASTRAMLAPGLAILLTPPLLGWIADGAGLWFAQIMMFVFLLLTATAFLVGQRLQSRN